MNEIAVSIIVPVYNVERYIEKCLNSLIGQTLKEIEIIVVNDFSPDNSERIILGFKKKDERIVYLKQSENQGQGFARNLGLEKARGEYLLFVDADDYIAKDAAEKLYVMAKELNLDVLEADHYKVFQDRLTEHKSQAFEGVLTGDQYFDTIPYTLGVVWNKLWRTKFLVQNNLYFVKGIFEDAIYLSTAMGLVKRVYRYNYTFYYYVIRENSTMTAITSPKHINCQIKVIKHLEKMYNQTKNRLGNYQRLKLLLYSFSGLAGYIMSFKPKNESEILLKKEAEVFLRDKHRTYRNKIFGCTKLGLPQKILLYMSPCLMAWVLTKLKK
ncbi:glycosyltransferase family 2 protein [Zobellia sp. B3R18]|uniref:glycosyltransferase family 2 protein n=1 Tax=Zobellia sp. B3R18 TaxID=2841568 RepID=UPI001C069C7D|nr:glycosyltransferase [Zobellia sp. B3R18]MBU2974887.1 glycosyltransferase [Zobellia sp. B3R18]